LGVGERGDVDVNERGEAGCWGQDVPGGGRRREGFEGGAVEADLRQRWVIFDRMNRISRMGLEVESS
jgi:hypothetical protein